MHQGGTLESLPVARSNALSRPGTGECRSFQGVRGFGTRVLRRHSLKGRAQTSALATPRSNQPEQTGSGGPTSFQALGGIPAPRPFVRPPAGPMLSTGGQYAVKKRKKAVPKRSVRGKVGGGRAAKTRKPGWGCGGGLSPPAALNPALCGSPGGSIADFIDSGRIDFV